MENTYLNTLFPDWLDGYLATWAKKSGATRFFHTSEFGAADKYMIALADHDDVYVGTTLLREPPSRGRGTAKDVKYVTNFHFDFDVLGDNNVHAKSSLPKGIWEVGLFLTEINIPLPTLSVDSGNGFHGYWPLEFPVEIQNEEHRREATNGLKDFQRCIIRLAKEMRGWEFDNTADLARVLRYPGTKNHKTNPPKNVEMF